MTDLDLLAYYAARATEYEKVYEKPERRHDLARLHDLIPAYFEKVICSRWLAARDIGRVALRRSSRRWSRVI